MCFALTKYSKYNKHSQYLGVSDFEVNGELVKPRGKKTFQCYLFNSVVLLLYILCNHFYLILKTLYMEIFISCNFTCQFKEHCFQFLTLL